MLTIESESSLDKGVTLIVTPHDDYRYPYLYRFLNYYKSWNYPFSIVILNSCPSEIDENLFGQFLKDEKIVHYKFDHSIRFELKLIEGLSKITTDYCAICSEDDFITVRGIAESFFFLEKNADYSAAMGKGIAFKVDKSHSEIKWELLYESVKSIEHEDAVERLSYYFANYRIPVYFALYRTPILRTIWQKTIVHTRDYRFGELLPALLTVIDGKIRISDVMYIAREYSIESQGQTLDRFDDFILDGSFKDRFKSFRQCLVEALSTGSDVGHKACNQIVHRGMKSYLGFSWQAYRLKNKIIRFLKFLRFYDCLHKISKKSIKTSLTDMPVVNNKNPYSDFDSPDHTEWKRIAHILEVYSK